MILAQERTKRLTYKTCSDREPDGELIYIFRLPYCSAIVRRSQCKSQLKATLKVRPRSEKRRVQNREKISDPEAWEID